MALSARIKSVEYEIATTNPQGVNVLIDHSLNGNLVAHVEYVDDTAPSVVLADKRFTFPSSHTEQDMLDQIFGYARMVLGARERTAALQVHVDSLIPVPPAPEE